jgi:hypothetical protein
MKLSSQIRGARRWTALAAALLASGASAQTVPPQGVPLPDLTPGYVLIEGDIQIRLDQFLWLQAGGGGDATFGGTGWPGGVVPFEFNANVTAAHRSEMLSCMAQISARAAVTFRARQGGDLFWLHIQESTGNNSAVGMVAPGQTVNIASWGSPFVIIHELYHALGFWHEQSRPDRNAYVIINNGNIQGGAEFNFFLNPVAGTYGPYDFDSIMHYDQCAFSIGCPPGTSCGCAPGTETITVQAPYAQWQNLIGQRDHFSHFDSVTMRGKYPFANDRWWQESSANIPQWTFNNPWIGPFANAVLATPANGTLFIGYGGTFHGTTGLYTTTGPVTIDAPNGAVTLGN